MEGVALSDAIKSAKGHVSSDYHLGIYDILNRFVETLPQRLLDRLEEGE